MGKYVYIDKDSKKGAFAIGVGVFDLLAKEAITRVPGIVTDPVESRHRHKLQFNNSEVEIHHGVVYVEVKVNAFSTTNLEKLKAQLTEEINTSFMMWAEQVPVEVNIKVENII